MGNYFRVLLFQYTALIASVLLAVQSEQAEWLKALLIFAAFIHARWGLYLADSLGLTRALFNMDLLSGFDHAFLLAGNIQEQQNPVPTIIKMEAPEDIRQFQKKVRDHFLSFKRCKQFLVQIGSEFFMRDITEAEKLNSLVEIFDGELDDKEIQNFTAKILEKHSEIIEQRPPLKIWLVPSKGNDKEEKRTIYIVAKFYHFWTDGLSIMQMFSLLQDGDDQNLHSNFFMPCLRILIVCICLGAPLVIGQDSYSSQICNQ